MERLLSEASRTSVRITSVQRIEPWYVHRAQIDDGSSVIVKQLRDDAHGFRVDPAQVRTEVAALGFVHELGLDIAPRLIASDTAENVLILEDLYPRVPLPGVLIEGDAREGRRGVFEFYRTLGFLSAASAGRHGDFDAPVGAQSPEDAELVLWEETLRFADEFGVPARAGARREIGAVFDELNDPGPFLALSNGDPGTNNFLVAPGLSGKLIDFEFARYRHALLDVVHAHVHSPQWVTLPAGAPFEAAYREQLAGTVSEAMDDKRFGFGLTAACLSYALVRLHRLPKLAPRRPGEMSRLQLVATLEAAAAVSEAKSALRELAGWCADVASEIRRRWPDTNIDLTALPPWLSRDERSEGIIDRVRTVSDGA